MSSFLKIVYNISTEPWNYNGLDKLDKNYRSVLHSMGFPGGAVFCTDSPVNSGDRGDEGSVPGLGRSPAGEHGNSLQYSFLENPMDRRAWQGHKESDTTEVTYLAQYSML